MRVVAIGRSEILFEAMRAVETAGHQIVGVVTAKEAPEYLITSKDFLDWANSLKLPVISSGKSPDLEKFCNAISADIAISVNYTSIIPQVVIDKFPLGILNAHGGDLPRYRGNACQAWAIINGEDRIGLCVHRMVGGEVDSGDIIARSYFPLNEHTYVTDCLEWLRSVVPDLFLEAINALEADPAFYLERQAVDPSVSIRCFPRRPEDGRIRWTLPADHVHRLIRASSHPYGGAYGFLGQARVTIWRSELVQHPHPFVAVAGQILTLGKDSIDVACGEAKDPESRLALRLSDFSLENDPEDSSSGFHSIRQRLE